MLRIIWQKKYLNWDQLIVLRELEGRLIKICLVIQHDWADSYQEWGSAYTPRNREAENRSSQSQFQLWGYGVWTPRKHGKSICLFDYLYVCLARVRNLKTPAFISAEFSLNDDRIYLESYVGQNDRFPPGNFPLLTKIWCVQDWCREVPKRLHTRGIENRKDWMKWIQNFENHLE